MNLSTLIITKRMRKFISKLITKIKGELLKNNIFVEKTTSKNDLENFISNFKKKYISCNLIRIGARGDGGYLLPNNLDDVDYCFSPGVSSLFEFEKELSDSYNIKSFMADGSVEGPQINENNFQFIKKFITSKTNENNITLSEWVKKSIGNDPGNKILQMDIEGDEYDVLNYEDKDLLSSFSILIIEFHDFHKLFDAKFFKNLNSIFNKIFDNFSICHVHPNNCCGLAENKNIQAPKVLEITFLRNDLISKFRNNSNIDLPHKLDKKNVEKNKEIKMPEIWWKN